MPAMLEDATGRTLTAHEPRETPWLSVVFGYGPMLPFVAGAAAAWWQRGQWDELILLATILYGAAILLFLSGVRRRGTWPDAGAVSVFGEDPPALLGVGHIVGGELVPDRLLSPLEIQQILEARRA